MSCFVLSLTIRLFATGWCLVLGVRFRDWRAGTLASLLMALVFDEALPHLAGGLAAARSTEYNTAGTAEWMSLLISFLSLSTVLFLDRIVKEHARTETLAAAFRASPDAMVLSALPTGHILEANEGFRKIIGHGPKEVIGKTPQELRLWADHAERVQMTEQLYSTGEVRDLGIHLRHKAGTLVSCQLTAEVVEIAGGTVALSILRDVSDHERAEAALRTSEAMFSTAFSASPDAITVSSLEEGKFVEVNESFERITGYSRDEAIGRTSLDLGLWSEQAERDHFRETLQRQSGVINHEVTFRHRSEQQIHCLVSAGIIDFSGELSLLMTVRDITDRRLAEEERAELIRELEAKNAELERFAYTLSHDLKSPLVTINGFLGLLEKDLAEGGPDRVTHDIGRIRGATDTMRRLVDELLELSRVGRIINSTEAFSLTDLARQAQEMVAGRMADRDVQIAIDPALPIVSGDRVRLLEVMQNLLDNAIKFMGDQVEPRIEVGVREIDGEKVFFVSDNGGGIDPRYLQKIFDLFDRLQPEIEGTGVGLALVKRIVEVHGGRVWAESVGQGRGSTFCFTLPQARTEADRKVGS